MGCNSSKTRSNAAPRAAAPLLAGRKQQFQEVDENGVPQIRFFSQANARLDRQYIIVVDRSGSMGGSNWRQAEAAVSRIASHVCEFDPDGVDVVFFSNDCAVFKNVRTPADVVAHFRSMPPSGGTNLTEALATAFKLHFDGPRTGTTILCITDGEPNNRETVKSTIEGAANTIGVDAELSLSFIQIGSDSSATAFLKDLDEGIRARFDIVDTLTAADMHGLSFEQLINKSIHD